MVWLCSDTKSGIHNVFDARQKCKKAIVTLILQLDYVTTRLHIDMVYGALIATYYQRFLEIHSGGLFGK